MQLGRGSHDLDDRKHWYIVYVVAASVLGVQYYWNEFVHGREPSVLDGSIDVLEAFRVILARL